MGSGIESPSVRRLIALPGRFAFRPETLPPDVVMGLALVPPVVAGLLLFRLVAVQMLGIALAAGVASHLAARLGRQPLRSSPAVSAVIGVALLGPAAPPAWTAAVALLASALEVARGRAAPELRFQAGLASFSVLAVAVVLGGRGMLTYLHPPDLRPFPEPVRLWLTYYPPGAAPLDPIRLYVGNVAGPVFATSVVAALIAAMWLWHARRLELWVVAGFLAGAAVPIAVWHWNPVFQLDSGPLWFALCLVLADRRLLPMRAPPVLLPLLGFGAGAVALGLRSRGYAIEAVPITIAAFQTAVSAAALGAWIIAQRHRLMEALSGLNRPPDNPFAPGALESAGADND